MNIFKKLGRIIPLMVLGLLVTNASAQNATAFQTSIRNIVQVSDRILDFDLYLLNLDPVETMELATYQAGIILNPAIYTGGTLTASIVAGSSTLTNLSQVPTSITYTSSATIIKLATKAPPGAGSGSQVIRTGFGTRIITIRLTSTVAFPVNSTPDFAFAPSTATNPSYPTAVALYVGGVNTQLPVSMGTNAFVPDNPPLNAPVLPVVFAVTGGGAYPAGGAGLPVGLAGSEIGVIYELYKDGLLQPGSVSGTGAAISFGNQTAGVYTIKGTNIAGTSDMAGSATISIIDFETSVRNVIQTSDRILEFDLYLLNKNLAHQLELASYQAGVTLNPGISAGTLSASILAGTSDLTNPAQVPTSITYTSLGSIIKLAAKAPPGVGSGSIISQVSPGTRIIKIRLTSTESFTANTTPNLVFEPSTAVPPSYPTAVAVYVGGLNVQMPVTMGLNAFVFGNPVLNPTTPGPTAFAITGGGTYCQGGTGLPVGLAGSETGVTYTLYKNNVAQSPTVSGTGAAISFGNQLAGIYTARGSDGTVTTDMTGTAEIIEMPLPVPTISGISTVCEGTTGVVYTTETGMSNYVWLVSPGGTMTSGGTSSSNTITITWNSAGSNSVSVNYTNGTCTAETATVLPVLVNPAPAAPVVSVTAQPTCTVATGTITVTSPVPAAGITYSIDGVTYTNTSGVFTGVVPGTYSVTVRNAAGCVSAPTSVVVNAAPETPAAPVVSVTAQPTCTVATGTITVTSPVPAAGITYSIDGV
ncbi:MAG TPA: hypothetical protein VHO50_13245, partial [Bacteroidales bacterium]|nr:hypothetical protein [Bacteroidales bacterium]